jgi:hypothetical protein
MNRYLAQTMDLYFGQESVEALIESLLTIVGQCRSIRQWYDQMELYSALLVEQYIESFNDSNHLSEAVSSKSI